MVCFQDYESDFEEDSGSGLEEEEEDSGDSEEEDEESSAEESDVDSPDPEVAAVLLALQQENSFDKRLERTYSVDVPEDAAPQSPEKKVYPGKYLFTYLFMALMPCSPWVFLKGWLVLKDKKHSDTLTLLFR